VNTLCTSFSGRFKEDGKARYDWVEQGGVWNKKPREQE
jgi:hypothetical protein